MTRVWVLGLSVENDNLRTENEKLWAALAKYADRENWSDNDVWQHNSKGYAIAEVALKGCE